MAKEAAMLLLLGSLYLTICCASTLNSSTIDEFSLSAIKKHINSDMLAKNWSQETSFCSWIGVICNTRQPRRVISLDLSNMDIRGSIAREIGNLSFLTSFDISNNHFSGFIPAEVGQLRRLRVLDMALNKLSDHIPESVGLLRRLELLNLTTNHLSGDIPTSLSTCEQLSILDLSYNNLTGSIPHLFGNLSQLQQLMLGNNQLAGELPSTIFNISSLVRLDASENRLSGSLPNDMSAPKLEHLLLYSNQFEGEIPSALTRCHSLQKLSMGHNKLEGSIPTGFWNLSKIQFVGLASNKLGGIIPPLISNLSKLEVFSIAYNSFQGIVPQEIGQLSHLRFLGVSSNKLNGEVPQSVFNLSRLEDLWLGYNNLSCTLPSSIGTSFPNLKYFDLSENHFHGRIPSSVSNLSGLILFQIGGNSFTGDIPINIGNLHQLEKLSLYGNQFTNNISKPEQEFISSMTNCKYLWHINIGGNPITGVLPKAIGSTNLSASLQFLNVAFCRIVSPLPDELGNLSNLVTLGLAGNGLTGLIPTALRNLNNLQRLYIGGNKLKGSISHVLCNLTKLYSVDFSQNYFSGQIPGCLGDFPQLKEIHLANNAFSSEIPSSLWLSEGIQKMNMSNNFINGSLPQEVEHMKSLIELDLSGNQLFGEIPDKISKLQNLIALSLSNNKLDGPLSTSFSELKGLEYLDLSNNNLSGPIPKPLEALTYLKYFNVSFNKLSGEIPDGGAFANFTSNSFLGNQGLCGAPRFKVEECKRSGHKHSRKTMLLKYILPAISSVLVVAFIWFLIVRNRSLNIPPSSPLDVDPTLEHRRFSYYEILHATGNLGERNLIGRGGSASVYKGCFGEKMVAAVKVFDSSIQGALVSFDTECQILSSIRHRNLVKVITSCSNLNFKALVLTFMPNGNLGKWLYSGDCLLNIFQTVEVMVDVATALEYLHNGYSSFPIVHCDLKPQNVLLDRNMVAHVADFGIARLLAQEQRVYQTGTLGTIGYMAPEYGSQGLVSTMVDVYSYGILLMEVCSRKKPTDEMFCGELTMRKWMQESFPKSVMLVVDNGLVNMDVGGRRVEYGSCFTSIVELALECTEDIPAERPSMKHVLERIKKIKSNLSQGN